MKKNWKKQQGLLLDWCNCFSFYDWDARKSFDSGGGNRIFEGLLEKTIESGQTSEEADLFGLSYQMVWLL